MRVDAEVVGFDGCGGGWIAAYWRGGGAVRFARLVSPGEAFPLEGPHPVAAIDIPIGLPDRAGAGGRVAEREVRPLLGGRKSSVFSVPSRAAVEASAALGPDEGGSYRHVCAVALETSDPPRALSQQAFRILPKILQVDRLLQERRDLPLWECHPEVSFWAMNGQKPLSEPKKAAPGFAQRRDLLKDQGMDVDQLTRAHARALGAGLDDLLDACACAWTAWRIRHGTALSFPDPPEVDGRGLPVAIRA